MTVPDPRNRRHLSDAVRLALALGCLAAAVVVVRGGEPGVVQINAFRLVNELPAAFAAPLIGVMQLGALAGVPTFALIALLGHRPRLARLLLLGGGLAWVLAKALQELIGQEPPEVILGRVTLHGAVSPGFSFPSTHVAVVAALAAVAGPYLARPNRRLAWSTAALVGVARMYVGAHFPIDVVGGAAVGWGMGSLIHLGVGAPRGVPGPALVASALTASGIGMGGVAELSAGPDGSARYRAATGQGASLFVKVLSRDNADTGWLNRAWHLLALREPEEEVVMASPSHRVDHEAYALLAAERQGLRVPAFVTSRSLGPSESLLARAWIDGTPLSQLENGAVGAAVLSSVWGQLRALHALGAAHGNPRAEHWVIDRAGNAWLVELATTRFDATDRDQLRDVAEVSVALCGVATPEQIAASAAEVLGADRVGAALSFLQPLALSKATRRGLGRRPGLLQAVRCAVAATSGQEAPPIDTPARVAARNLLPLFGGLLAVNLLLPQVGQAQATLDALHHVRWGWLAAAASAAAGSYLMAALALLGAARERLALGRTWAVQVAAAFTNRITPAGVGGMRTNVRYLEAAGTPRPSAIATVGLNTVAGFVVHVVGLLAIVPLLGAGGTHLRFHGPDLGDNAPYLAAAITILVAAGMVRWARLLVQRVAQPLRTATSALAAVVRRPAAAAALFGGSAGVTLCYALALAGCTRAFGLGLGLPAVIAIFLGGSAVGSVSVTPGGLGVLEGALAAGLTAAGAASGPAIAAVLTYRLITYWLPVVPGFAAYRVLRRSGSI
jgi:undecaprenyl-diphosphatase